MDSVDFVARFAKGLCVERVEGQIGVDEGERRDNMMREREAEEIKAGGRRVTKGRGESGTESEREREPGEDKQGRRKLRATVVLQ